MLDNKTRTKIIETAFAMSTKGKGILAADESTPTIKKRFDTIGVESNREARVGYRNMLFTTPDLDTYISGVILFDETARQLCEFDTVPRYLSKRGIIPGIKVDKGAKTHSSINGDKITEGLDGLCDRLAEYREMGLEFAKWRAVLNVGMSSSGFKANAWALAEYAARCQEEGIVPIVEPEVLMDGKHSIKDAYEATDAALNATFSALRERGVILEGIVLKPNMVLSGYDGDNRSKAEEVAARTLRVLQNNVPVAVPGIAFLSGGQTDEDASIHLNLMNDMMGNRAPWALTFSYGRALQGAVLKSWQGDDDNFDVAQKTLLRRARCNGMASLGKYDPSLEGV